MGTTDVQVPRESLQEARDVLGRVFGFEKYRKGQEAVITRLLAGKNVLSIFPTGGGKSLCYELPALLLDGLTMSMTRPTTPMRQTTR